jgi:hypothetical protein
MHLHLHGLVRSNQGNANHQQGLQITELASSSYAIRNRKCRTIACSCQTTMKHINS